MELDLPSIPDAARTPLVLTLLALMDQQQQHLHTLQETVQQLRDEIAVLQGQQARPTITPSQLSKTPKTPDDSGPKRPGSAKRAKNASFLEPLEVVLPFPNRPPGAVGKGYEEYFVQELVLHGQVTRYLRERIELPDGTTQLAPLPADVLPGSHFGPLLIGYVLYQHNQCHVTQPKLLEQLPDLGIAISAGQLNRLRTEDHAVFHQEKAEVLRVGLQTATYVGVDDTSARQQGQNGYGTALGNDLFAYFESTESKSRLNFLNVLRGPATAYTINEVAVAYWQRQELSQEVVAKRNAAPWHFADEGAWPARLRALAITSPRHVRIATEGALLGQVIAQGVSPDLVILSDGAGPFNVLAHAACWVHAERPLVRMIPYNEAHRAVIAGVRQQVWDLYQELRAYPEKPDPVPKPALEARFDALSALETAYPRINQLLKDMRTHKADLLRVLDCPQVPLHNNGTESIIRVYVQKRKVSGSTGSAAGRRCRDTFTSLMKTCRKLGISFWAYLQDRIRGGGQIPRLAEVIGQRAAEAASVRNAEAVPAGCKEGRHGKPPLKKDPPPPGGAVARGTPHTSKRPRVIELLR